MVIFAVVAAIVGLVLAVWTSNRDKSGHV